MSHPQVESTERSKVDLFTNEEHRVLAHWFEVDPPHAAAGCSLDEALERLGFAEDPTFYVGEDAAVAFVLLERVEKRLPSWGRYDGEQVTVARKYRESHQVPERRVALAPRHLFTLNWADSGPGFSWPGAYYCTWVPGYDRYVVTYSGDTPEVFGYCDFALGHFGREEELKEGCRGVVTADWTAQYEGCSQGRWAYLFSTGQVGEEEANTWADAVWPEGEDR